MKQSDLFKSLSEEEYNKLTGPIIEELDYAFRKGVEDFRKVMHAQRMKNKHVRYTR